MHLIPSLNTRASAQVHAILSAGMTAILCIGESKQEYEAGQARQVRGAGGRRRQGARGVRVRPESLDRHDGQEVAVPCTFFPRPNTSVNAPLPQPHP